ncbi:MAG: ribosome-recycling factor, partial [Acidimicrobiales bacterium]
IREADLGLNPSNDGTIIRLGFPILTEERRRDYVRMVKAMAEEGRIRIRGLRRGARHDLDALHKDGDASEDEVRLAEKELDKLTHAGEAGIDSALGEKETELLEV